MARGFGTTYGAASTDKISGASWVTPSQFSFAGWYLRNGEGGLSSGRIFDKTGTNGVSEVRLFRASSANINFTRDRATDSAHNTTDAEAVANNKWVHIVVTQDGTTAAPLFYINGRSATVNVGNAGSGSVTLGAGEYTVGNRGTSGTQWDGILGDQAVWGAVLTAAEAWALYQGADPLSVRPQYLMEVICMRSGVPVSLVRTQPVTTGTKPRGDRLTVEANGRFPFTSVPAAGITGASLETDTALSLVPVQISATGTAVETDNAIALSVSRPAGLAAEADSALALTSGSSSAVGQAGETDTALALAGVTIQAAGLASETSAALTLGAVAIRAVGVAASGETSLPLGSARPAAPANDNEAAISLAPVSVLQCGASAEIDAAQSCLPVQIRLVGASTETDTAVALSVGSSSAIGRADETDIALALQGSTGPTPPDRTVTSTRLRSIVGNARGTRSIVSPPRKRAA